ncbi:nucleoside recognition domain-containing protein [Paenibacillus sp. ACRRX]|uniref:nucleoside recognition domain-containing protein n=1 Tax=Paenibacillus sp. ACRRX TaxID=2918206 RepID=UPI001EF43A88|nr:nucleoside recognition domain-containing protein [Paenibacillus sp. ACRRX]MCG7407548.1 nucleoside recognition domain-containing protein [Paenibacillus sp. ACRRX]
MQLSRFLRSNRSQHPLYTAIAGSIALILVVCIVSYPDAAFKASLQGLKVWWNIIFPALLPFLVLSEMLVAYGWVHGLGVLFNPIMRWLLRLPGVGGWAWAVGWTAGYPAGAEAVVKLRRQQLVNRQEGERLLGLSHASNPVFIIAVVGVGFMQHADTGLIIAIVHWAAALLSMLLLRVLDNLKYNIISNRTSTGSSSSFQEPVKPSVSDRTSSNNQEKTPPSSFSTSLIMAMENAHRHDSRPLGKLLGDAVTTAVQTLMMIGGYMMIFSVIVQVLRIAIPQQFGSFMLNGLLEINLGTFAIGTAAFDSPVFQAALMGAVIAWSGASAHLQVHSLIKGTDLRYSRFLRFRLLHAAVAFGLTYVIWAPMQIWLRGSEQAAPVFETSPTIHGSSQMVTEAGSFDILHFIQIVAQIEGWQQPLVLLTACTLFICLLVCVSTICYLLSRLTR